MTTDTPRYTAIAIALHWILAVLLIGMVFFLSLIHI